jgi:hypothetical protein
MPLLKFNPPTEAEEQEAFFKMVRLHESKHPELSLVFMIPNGAKLQATYERQADGRNLRYSREGERLKLQGLRNGVPDIFCAVPKSYEVDYPLWTHCAGLWIELKRINARPSDTRAEQREMHVKLRVQGYRVEVCKGWRAAWNCLIDYLELKELEVS